MSVLVIAEHDGTSLKPGTFNAVTAAKALDGDIHVLVAGWQCDAVVQAASRIAGVTQVLHLAREQCIPRPDRAHEDGGGVGGCRHRIEDGIPNIRANILGLVGNQAKISSEPAGIGGGRG